MLSVCIVTGRRIPLLDACLASLADQDDPPPFEVLVCSDGDPDVEAAVLRRFPEARVCAVVKALPGAARNLLVAEAEGDLLVFLDDDVTVDRDMLRRLDTIAASMPHVGVFGGPNDTPPDSSHFQFVQGAVLASMVGSGPVRRRYGAHPAGPADQTSFILCNLAVRRDVMVPFPPELICAEENAILHELADNDVAMHYDPSLVVYHQRRPTLKGFAQQMFKYGRGRGQLMVREPGSFRVAYFVPSGVLVYAVASPALTLAFGPLALVPLAAYGAAVGASAVWVAGTLRRPAAIFTALACFGALHSGYGAGLVRGLFDSQAPQPEPEVISWTNGVPPRTEVVGPA